MTTLSPKNVWSTSAPSVMVAPVSTRERYGIAPNASLQGSGLPFAGRYSGDAKAAHTTQAPAVRTDAQVPPPRERQR